MGKYKYFTDEEVRGLDEKLCLMLDCARDVYGFPIRITSGYRTPERNAEIGSKPDSAHIRGLAVDIATPSSPIIREKLFWALGLAGFRRVESCPRHAHVDLDGPPKPSPFFWEGDDR